MQLKDIKNTTYLAKGHRGILYIGDYKGKKVVIKTKRPDSEAVGRMENEANSLKILNQKGIGPKFLYYNKKKDYLIYEYVDGEFFPIFLRHSDKKNKNMIRKIIKQAFLQCRKMDMLRMDKEEMHHPFKHIIIEKVSKKPVMIDFERCHHVDVPKNVTQFSTYMISEHITKILKDIGINVDRNKVIESAKRYKKCQTKKNLDSILKHII